jgi:16S rRNA G966 N2-methylase RsmD
MVSAVDGCVYARATRARAVRRGKVYVAARGKKQPPPPTTKKKKTQERPNTTTERGRGGATELTAATLGGVEENHALEQFFYDDETTKRLMTIAKRYERPVFMCNPSLASAWERERAGEEYVLLDCDMRFKGLLKGFKAFNLFGPFAILRFQYDVVFCDPPFANVTPAQVKRAIDMMAGTEEQRDADVYLAYNSDREDVLLSEFDGLARMGRSLGYKSVKEGMQQKIHLYGPKV